MIPIYNPRLSKNLKIDYEPIFLLKIGFIFCWLIPIFAVRIKSINIKILEKILEMLKKSQKPAKFRFKGQISV
jgi:hypothetical protein